jgi:hypothetical protein
MWKQASGVAFGLVGGLCLGAVLHTNAAPKQQAVPEVIRAQSFELVNRNGKKRASLSLDSWGDPSLALDNVTGRMHIKLELHEPQLDGWGARLPGGASFDFMDEETQQYINVSLDSDYGESISLNDLRTNAIVRVELDEAGLPIVQLQTKDGKKHVITPYGEDEKAFSLERR